MVVITESIIMSKVLMITGHHSVVKSKRFTVCNNHVNVTSVTTIGGFHNYSNHDLLCLYADLFWNPFKSKSKSISDDDSRSYPLSLCLEFRVMHKSKAFMCPASQSLGQPDAEHIVYIEVLSTLNTPGVREYFKDIGESWMKMHGVPHWQKQWTFLDDNGSMVEHIKKEFGGNLKRFNEVRDALKVDENNMFVNSVYKHFVSEK